MDREKTQHLQPKTFQKNNHRFTLALKSERRLGGEQPSPLLASHSSALGCLAEQLLSDGALRVLGLGQLELNFLVADT